MDFKYSDLVNRLPESYFARLDDVIAEVKMTAGSNLIDMSDGGPDLDPPKAMVDYLNKETLNPDNHRYGPYRGLDELKEAVAVYYKRNFDVDVDPLTEVAIFDGSKGGLVKVAMALLNSGDTVLLGDPYYPDYASGIAIADAKVQKMPLLEENDYLPVLSDIPEDVAHTAKMMYLNYPNNPTGATANKDFFEKVVEFGKTHQTLIVNDAAYGHLVLDGSERISLLQAKEAKEVAVEFFTASKMLNVPGWRLGFAVGNPSVIEALNLLQEHTTIGLYAGLQKAVAYGLREEQDFVDSLKDVYNSRLDIFFNELGPLAKDSKKPRGSFFAWIKIPEDVDAKIYTDTLLRDYHVVVANGEGFGENGKGYFRIALTKNESVLKEAAKRMREAYLSLK